MSSREPDFQRRAATVRRVDALFQAMSTDFLLREQFVTDPTQVLSEYLDGTQVPTEQASVTNQLIYAVVSNRELMTWLHEYVVERRDNVPSGDEFVAELAKQVVDRGAGDVVVALMRASASEVKLFGLDEDLLHYVFNLSAVADGVEDPRVLPEVPEGTGGTGATGTLTAVTWSTFTPGTGGGTGTGTGGTGTGTGVTHHSPWPGPFTNIPNPPGFGREGEEYIVFAPDYVMVTLDALASYATQLRDAGALDRT